ncbi:membrane protein [Paenibacillus baekrokdamisoli]|uniref:Membrane protein n=1 Tax=Paenibacillus baekrokdamisoli TaxID=1712516 RepID=A0A3G9JF08_9BACL|nr:SPFH domain-containing protein [Paenibacillus baekrokdamisoli]MBB3071468.1 flotillin [Paenibacillus baekrokdamisoli]BBH24501.1 membrane protein [Paenibacillus baekrokdamisoli]
MSLNWTLIIPIGVVVVLFLLGIVFASRYRTVKADEAMIITGAMTGDGPKVVKAGGTFVWPILQNASFLSLQLYTLHIKTPEVYTSKGVAVMVDGVAQIKIKGDIESITTAAEQFLGKPDEELQNICTQTLEGHLRAILGTMTVEDVYKNREDFAKNVQEIAATDLNKMGFQIVSFTISDVRDRNGFLESLGQAEIARVKKDAEVAKAENQREELIKKSQAIQEGKIAEFEANTKIAEAEKIMEIRKAEFKKEQDLKKAEADVAYKLQEAKSMQAVTSEQMNIKVIEKEKQIELDTKEIERKQKELEATVMKQADADRYAAEQKATADRFTIEQKAAADAEAIKVEGLAEAEVVRAKGLAHAEAKGKLAEAMAKYGEAAMLEMLYNVLPDIARAVAEPLSKTEKIVIVDSGNGQGGGGASKITGYITDIMATLPEAVQALAGADLTQILRNVSLPKLQAESVIPQEKLPETGPI